MIWNTVRPSGLHFKREVCEPYHINRCKLDYALYFVEGHQWTLLGRHMSLGRAKQAAEIDASVR